MLTSSLLYSNAQSILLKPYVYGFTLSFVSPPTILSDGESTLLLMISMSFTLVFNYLLRMCGLFLPVSDDLSIYRASNTWP